MFMSRFRFQFPAKGRVLLRQAKTFEFSTSLINHDKDPYLDQHPVQIVINHHDNSPSLVSPIAYLRTTGRTFSEAGGIKSLQRLKKSHVPHISCLVAEDSETNELQLPLAIKRGGPLTYEDRDKINPKEDIWVLSEDDDGIDEWEPPTTHVGVTETERYQMWMRLIGMATRDTRSGRAKIPDIEILDNQEFRSEEERIEFENLMAESLPKGKDARHIARKEEMFLYEFYSSLNNAIEQGWPSGFGRKAVSYFLQGAVDACENYAVALEDEYVVAERYQIKYDIMNLGGEEGNNVHNCRCAVKKANDDIVVSSFEDREVALRNKSEWDRNDFMDWHYNQHVPDVVLTLRAVEVGGNLRQKIGLLLAAVKSESESLEKAEIEVITQALRGLAMYGPKAAAVVVHPTTISFNEVTVENGFVNRRKKYYMTVDRYKPINGKVDHNEVDHTKYKEFFTDLVLYIWNTYYREQYRSLQKCG